MRHAARGLWRAPAFSVPLVVTIALGLGANTAVVGVLDAVLWRPLPYARPAELVRVFERCSPSPGRTSRGVNDVCAVSAPGLRDWREQARGFTGIAGYTFQSVSLQSRGGAERLRALGASPELFAVLGVPAGLGRTLRAGDGAGSGAPPVVVSQGLFQQRFAGDRRVLGRTLWLDGHAYTVVGVMPAGFDFPPAWDIALWVPLTPAQAPEDRGNHWLRAIARLAPGRGLAAAEAEMEGIAARLSQAYPAAQAGRGAGVLPLGETVVGEVRPKLMVVAAAAALVLLIACANAASLMLARAIARRRELGVRAALGASGWQLGRLAAIEATVVSLAGAALALVAAQLTLRMLGRVAGQALPLSGDALSVLEPRVFLLLAATALGTAVVTALVPALQTPARRLIAELQAGSARSGQGAGATRVRSLLVVGQVALSTVLLVGATLLLRTLGALLATPTGMTAEHSVAFAVTLPSEASREAAGQLLPRILDRVQGLPEVRAAGWTSHLPLRQWGYNSHFAIAGRPPAATPAEAPFAEVRLVSPGYFAALGIPVLRGRNLQPQDGDPRTPGALVNRALVERYFRDREPLGERVSLGDEVTAVPASIVGVVGDVREATLDREPTPTIFFSTAQPLPDFLSAMTLVVRSPQPTPAIAAEIRRALGEVAPGQAVFDVAAMPAVVARSLSDRRLVMGLLASFGGVAPLLAAAGLYGLLAYLVSQGRREIGIRMALGAARGTVLRLVLGDGLRLLTSGLALGLLLAVAASRWLGSLLYGVSPLDVPSLAAVAVVLAAVGLAALWLPARRALRVDPASVLRDEA